MPAVVMIPSQVTRQAVIGALPMHALLAVPPPPLPVPPLLPAPANAVPN